MRKISAFFFACLFIVTGCKTMDKAETELIHKANFRGEVNEKIGFLSGVNFQLNYNDLSIVGEFMIDGVWGPQLSGYSVNIKIGDRILKGKLRMTYFLQNYEIELLYGTIPISGMFKREFFNTWNWEIDLNIGINELSGTIEQNFSTVSYNLIFGSKKIKGSKQLQFIKESYQLSFDECSLNGSIFYKFGKENWLFQADQITEEDIIIFIILDFLRIIQQDYERMQKTNKHF